MRYGLVLRAAATLVVAVAALLGPVAGGAGAQAAGTGQVVVVHGLRGVVADVSVDGKVVLKAFEPERTTDPLTLPAGRHTVEVRKTGSPATSTPVLKGTFDLAAGSRLSAVVHLGDDKKPQLTFFRDDVSAVTAGRSRLVVRDTAAAPALDVELNQAIVARNLVAPRQSAVEVAANRYRIAVLADKKVLATPQDVPLAEGSVSFLYLIGSADDHSLGWLAQRVEGVAKPPVAVKTGNSGLADPGHPFPTVAVAALAMLALSTGLVTRRLRR
jgi:hypothetical protein